MPRKLTEKKPAAENDPVQDPEKKLGNGLLSLIQ